ncbi:M20 family metallopeptidase [Consotaella salsifontis]|uniref:Glutamate carboxypeptidase n=1 Tax=Consotaella salsifontis TaxID=1365950 RepID=A0A1T4S7A4_9HYPH|nr:M20 family metallopeptidase [Consotaella salsifontis]SKA24200.1 glutamate carboxypeptidase [Consotaella salsifontis]
MALRPLDIQGYLKDLEFIVNIDSGSRDREGVAKVAEFFKRRFSAIGWQVRERIVEPSLGPCLEVLSPGCADHYDILLLGHLDTVFPKGTAKARPFRTEGDRAFGPGVMDMKSGSLYALHLAEALSQAGGTIPSICIALNSHEEIGSVHARPWLEEIGAKSRYALVLEPARANGNLVNQRKGSCRYAISFHGKAAHSGVDPEKGASAIEELAHWVVALHGLTDLQKGLNLNAGLVSGGTAVNAIADKAEMALDVRLVSLDQAELVQATLDEMVRRPFVAGVTASVSGGLTRPPMNPTEETMALCAKVDAIAARLGVKIGWQATGGGSDGAFTAALGIPTLDGMGPIGGAAHSEAEYLELDSLAPRFSVLAELVHELTGR